jgi:hypothetical protein
MDTEHWWNDTGWEKGCPRRDTSVSTILPQKSCTHLLGVKPEWLKNEDRSDDTAEKILNI